MRRLLLAFNLLPFGLFAQPGWIGMDFTFVLEKDGAEVPHAELRDGKEYSFEVEGKGARVFGDRDPRYSLVPFPAQRSDPMRHVDTLWFTIRHRDAGVMEIGFPPRAGRNFNRYYLTDHLVVPFAPGRVMVTDLTTELHVTGIMTGLGQWWNGGPTFTLDATCGCDTVRNVASPLNGEMDFRLRCPVAAVERGHPTAHLQFTSDGPYQPDLHMRVLGRLGGNGWDLGKQAFTPTRQRIVGYQVLAVDDAAARDTVYGWDRLGNVVHLSNLRPTAKDSLHLRFWWLGGGEEVHITHRVAPTFEGEQLLIFEVQRLSVELDRKSGYQERELDVVVPPLVPGAYSMHLVYVDPDGSPAPRFDALAGQPLMVRW